MASIGPTTAFYKVETSLTHIHDEVGNSRVRIASGKQSAYAGDSTSNRAMVDAFRLEESVSFEVENYLQYKGEQFSELFDANSYILMTKVMDSYDAGKDKPLVEALKEVKAEFLIVGFYSDWLYPPERGKEIQIAAMNNNIRSSFVVLQGDHGHDSFLFSSKTYSNLISNFIES